MIDSVRALRYTFPNVSDRWAALGDSQGGGAAWSADEQASSYASELHLLGALASSPAPDLTGLVDKAQQGTLTPEQQLVIQAVIESLARLKPDLDRDDFRRGAAADYWNVLSNCSSDAAYRRSTASEKLRPGDFAPHTAEAGDRLRTLLRLWALPQRPLSAPLYVWYGGKDPFIDAEWTAAAIRRACALGGIVTIKFDPNGGHNPPTGMQLIKWMEDRFAGKPAANDC
jgi:pimeloyl-ACP methyl ester carboxylesterase